MPPGFDSGPTWRSGPLKWPEAKSKKSVPPNQNVSSHLSSRQRFRAFVAIMTCTQKSMVTQSCRTVR